MQSVYVSKTILAAVKHNTRLFTRIQSFWRGVRTRQHSMLMHTAALRIQKCFRRRDPTAMLRFLQRERRQDLVDYLRVTAQLVGDADKARACLMCPINKEVTSNPVLNLRDGHVYDADSLRSWLHRNYTSPVTRAFTLPWHVVTFRQASHVFDAMSDCLHGRDFRCPCCHTKEFRFGGTFGFGIASMWLRCQQHLISDCEGV